MIISSICKLNFKEHVTIKIFQHDYLVFKKCNHGITYVKLNVTLDILEVYGFEIEEKSGKYDFKGC